MYDYVSRWGLHRDPFDFQGDATPLFFDSPRQLLLDQLIQVSVGDHAEYGSLLVLTGPLGSGKSTLIGCLSEILAANHSVLVVQATLFMGKEQLLDGICQALGLQLGAGDDHHQLQSRISDYLSQLETSGRELLLVIDDAHELGDDALRALLEILTTNEDAPNLRILLVGEQQLEVVVRQLVASTGSTATAESLEMSPLSAKEIQDYLRFQLEGAGYRGAFPLPARELDLLVQQSGGVLATVNALARDALEQAAELKAMPRLSIPPVYWASAGVLTLALLLAVFSSEDPDASRSVALTAQPIPQATIPSGINDTPLSGQSQLPLQDLQDVQDPQQVSRQLVVQNLEAAAPSQPVDRAVAEPMAGDLANLPTTPVENVEAPPAAPVRSTAPPATYSLHEQRLLAMAPDSFTLQLLASHSEASVQEFIKQRGDGDRLAYFESRYQDRPWFVTVFGSYSSREQAEAAKVALPVDLQSLNPWVRNLAAIQSDIRKFSP